MPILAENFEKSIKIPPAYFQKSDFSTGYSRALYQKKGALNTPGSGKWVSKMGMLGYSRDFWGKIYGKVKKQG
jgi:hypothetical protein